VQIRTILVPLFGGDNDQQGLDQGFVLGRKLCAHIDALFVRPDPEEAVPYLGIGDGHLEETKEQYRRSAETLGIKAATKARRRFNAACRKHGIAKAKRPNTADGPSTRWVKVQFFGRFPRRSSCLRSLRCRRGIPGILAICSFCYTK
jgi:hypothetical protein